MSLTQDLMNPIFMHEEIPGMRFAKRIIPIQVNNEKTEFQTTPFTFKIEPELVESEHWNLDALSEKYCNSVIPVAIGPRIGGHLEKMTVRDAAKLFQGLNGTHAYARQIPVPGPLSGIERRKIFSLVVPSDRLRILNLWIGPKNTLQPFHKDNHNSLALLNGVLLQLHGTKEVLLVSNKYDDCMYSRCSAGYTHHSNIDMMQFNDAMFPLFKNVEIQKTILEQGNGIFIPGDTWHHVRSLSCSVSMSVWWYPSVFVDRIYRAALASNGASVNMPERLLGMQDLEEGGDFHQLENALAIELTDAGRRQFMKYCDAKLNACLFAAGT